MPARQITAGFGSAAMQNTASDKPALLVSGSPVKPRYHLLAQEVQSQPAAELLVVALVGKGAQAAVATGLRQTAALASNPFFRRPQDLLEGPSLVCNPPRVARAARHIIV